MIIIKSIHMLTAFISILGFIIRGILAMTNSPVLDQKWIKIIPHINDTVLLGSAIMLASMTNQNPIEHSWLTAKVIALLAYITLGMIALRFGKTNRQRIIAWLLAIATFGYIVTVAINHNPMGFLI